MNVLVTGADGFVGSWLVPKLAAVGHKVTATVHRETKGPAREQANRRLSEATEIVELDLMDQGSVEAVASPPYEAVVHLAAASSGAEVLRDPARGWEINAVGTVRLAECLAKNSGRPLVLFASSGDVYGRVDDEAKPNEQAKTRPVSPYAASKLAAEIGLAEVCARTGLRYLIARTFAHTGARQDHRFVVPAFAKRIIDGKKMNAVAVPVGNLEIVRDFLHVSDVVAAYTLLLEKGEPGQVYNIASGEGTNLRDVFFMVADAAGSRVIPEVNAAYVRRSDIRYLVGDATKLRTRTGWKPTATLKEAIEEVVNASSQ